MENHPELELEWTGFQLRPDTPVGGALIEDMFPGGYIEAKREQFKEFAKEWGVEDFHQSDRMPNTLRVLALAEYARAEGKLRPFREAAMQAHWYEARFLEDTEVLRELATTAGLDADAAIAAADSEELQNLVTLNRARANAMGITGIPTYIFVEEEEGLAVVGCQKLEVLEDALSQLRAHVAS